MVKKQGIQLEADFGFFLCVSIFLITDQSGMGELCLLSIFLHELGHFLVLWLLKIRVKAIRLRCMGIKIEREEAPSLGKELAVNLAGPMVNLLLAVLLLKTRWIKLSAINCALGLFELCPLPSLDGGQALFCVLQRYMSFERAYLFCTSIEKTTFILIMAVGMCLAVAKRNGTLLVLLFALGISLLPERTKKRL